MSVRDGAADTGKNAHLLCEEFERGKLDVFKFDEAVVQRAKPYLDWYDENVEKTYFVEKPVFSRTLFAGGTPDGGFLMKDGRNLINDKKFKNSIFDPKPHWQMAAYRMMLEEMAQDTTTPVRLELDSGVEEYKNPQEYLGSIGGLKWDGSVILLLPPTEKEKEPEIKPIYRYAYEEDKNSFMAAVTIYRALQAYKS